MTAFNSQNPDPILRGALVGFGNVAVNAHLPLWRRNRHFGIEAVVEPDPERARLAKRLLPEARIYPTLEALAAEIRLDFVDICTPPCFHGDLMVSACRSGFHVFCEKPLVTSLADLQKVRKAAGSSGCAVFSVNNWKHSPLWAKTLELMHENRIGAVRSVSLSVLRPPNSGGGASDWRRKAGIAGGGILLDHGWHSFYLVLALIGESPLAVSGRMGYLADGSDMEDEVDVVLKFSQAEARLHLTWRAPSRSNLGLIAGERGTLAINDDHLILNVDGLPSQRYDFPEALSAGSHHLEWMAPVVENFRREVLDPGVRGANLQEATWCSRLIESSYRSQREGSSFLSVADGFDPEAG